jgi:hypothetical protein
LDTHKERAEAQLRQQMQWAEERLRSELKKKVNFAFLLVKHNLLQSISLYMEARLS